jgi:hypothetical protein
VDVDAVLTCSCEPERLQNKGVDVSGFADLVTAERFLAGFNANTGSPLRGWHAQYKCRDVLVVAADVEHTRTDAEAQLTGTVAPPL